MFFSNNYSIFPRFSLKSVDAARTFENKLGLLVLKQVVIFFSFVFFFFLYVVHTF